MTKNIYTNQYGSYFVPDTIITDYYPDGISSSIRAGKVYERQTIEYIKKLSKGNSVITAGTYFGDFMPALSKSFKTVYGFEPSGIYYDACLKTIKLNGIQNAKIFNKGIGEFEEYLYYQEYQDSKLSEHRGGAARFLDKNDTYNGKLEYQQKKSILMKVTTLDIEIPKDEIIDVLHLDIEGLEQQALAGSNRIISTYKPAIIVETTPNEDWFNLKLRPLGYALIGKVNHNTIYQVSTK
jgi:FkbM family methyltransferase